MFFEFMSAVAMSTWETTRPDRKNSRLRLALNYLSYAISAGILAPFVVKDRPDAILVYQISPATMATPALVAMTELPVQQAQAAWME